MSDPRRFFLFSEYPTDQILYLGQFEVRGLAYGDYSSDPTKRVPHGLPFTPLVLGLWSFNKDYSGNVYDTGVSLAPRGSQYYGVNVWVEGGNICLFAQFDGATTTAYVDVIAFAPSTWSGKISNIAAIKNKVPYYSGRNYLKLVKSGVIVGSGTVRHGLGYVPQALLWQDDSYICQPAYGDNITPSGAPAFEINIARKVDNTNLIVEMPDNTYKTHYRIYADE